MKRLEAKKSELDAERRNSDRTLGSLRQQLEDVEAEAKELKEEVAEERSLRQQVCARHQHVDRQSGLTEIYLPF